MRSFRPARPARSSRFGALALLLPFLLWPLLLSGTSAQTPGVDADVAGNLSVREATPGAAPFPAVSIRKQPGTVSALDVHLDGTGNALRIFAKGDKAPGTYFHDSGMLHTRGWVTISGTTNQGGAVQPPTGDPSMLAIWSDVNGPAVQVRSANSTAVSYLFQGLDREGDYTFSVEQNGGLRWGAAARASMDTNLYRSTKNTLKTDGSLVVAGRIAVGKAASTSALHVGGSQSVRRTAVSADYAVGDDDYYVGVADTSRARTVTLPAAAGRSGRVYIIKDESGKAGERPVTVRARPGETIDGRNAQAIRTGYGVLRVISSGKGWFGM